MKFCTKTTIPESAVNVTFNEEGISSVYSSNIQFQNLSKEVWKKRQEKFEKIVTDSKSDENYDCVIGVSGGKDSYYQVHICLQYGLKPLLVTYHGNNFLPEGDYNRDRMRDVFNCDHLIFFLRAVFVILCFTCLVRVGYMSRSEFLPPTAAIFQASA